MANYILRKVDDGLWQSFRARAATDGHSLRWLLLELIRRYAKHGLSSHPADR
jgi:plasmid stability protein